MNIESIRRTNTNLASGAVFIIGPGGDMDPSRAMEGITFSNQGATQIRVADSLSELFGSQYHLVPVTSWVPFPGPIDCMVIKTDTAAASSWSMSAIGTVNNSARDGVKSPKRPGNNTRYRTGRLGFTAGATVATTVDLKLTKRISAIKLYAGAAPATGAITLTITDSKGRNLLSAANFDLTSLVGGTLTTLTLTASTDLLLVTGPVTLTVASDNGGGACVVAYEFSYAENG